MLAKVLAKHIDACQYQTGFIGDVRCHLIIRQLLNVLFSPPLSKTSEMIISLDAEKAFDHVEWNYLFTLLKKFGFELNIISWIRLIFGSLC